jgi:hypothetical protein
MTDAMGPGSHVLYQDFVVPTVVATASVSFSVFIQNQHTEFIEAGTLDFVPAQNQHARVDIMTIPADPFAPGADLMNLFLTSPGDPLVSGYNPVVVDITAFLQAHQGETLRLRFAEVDNVNFFNMGVDDVRLTAIIPEPSSWVLMLGGLIGVAGLQRRSTAR